MKHNISGTKHSFLVLLVVLLLKEFLAVLQFLVDDGLVGLPHVARNDELIENEVGLPLGSGTWWKLKMRSSSQTFPKYLSST